MRTWGLSAGTDRVGLECYAGTHDRGVVYQGWFTECKGLIHTDLGTGF